MHPNIKADNIKHQGELSENVFNALIKHLEKRRYPRIKKNLDIIFKKMDSRRIYKMSITRDISIAGFRIDLDGVSEPISPGETIEAIIRASEGEEGPIRVIGRVVWVKEKCRGFEMGIMLICIDKKDEEKFIQCLRDHRGIKKQKGSSKA